MKCVLLIHVFVLSQITVPPVPTYYHCKVMKFPKLLTKHHIYQVILTFTTYCTYVHCCNDLFLDRFLFLFLL